MENMGNWVKGAIAAIGGALAWFFGPWDILIMVLLAFVAGDYLMGVINAAVHRELSSEIGWRGLLRKAVIFFAVALGVLLDKLMPGTNGAVRAAVCVFYISNEGLSILENMAKMGVPLPAQLKGLLLQLREKDENG